MATTNMHKKWGNNAFPMENETSVWNSSKKDEKSRFIKVRTESKLAEDYY